jgi:hypothetical protein
MAEISVMRDWYISDGGSRWQLCRVVSNRLGVATVELYTGEPAKGKARKGLYGWLVDAI